MILKAVGHPAGVSSRIHLKPMFDPVLVENIVQFTGIRFQSILVARRTPNCLVGDVETTGRTENPDLEHLD